MRKILYFVVFLVLLFIAFGLYLPSKYTVKTSIIIDTDKAEIHKVINNLKQWDKWAPWATNKVLDVFITYGDITQGIGATQKWKDASGKGYLVITKSEPEIGIEYNVFFDGSKHKNISSISYTSIGNKTEVTWVMEGEIPVLVLGGYIAHIVEFSIAQSFNQGLEALKNLLENH